MKTKYPYVMPFMYNVYSNDMEYEYTIVKIGLWDMTAYNHRWSTDPRLDDKEVFQPDIDLTQEEHRFDEEEDALEFIRKWWAKQGAKK